MGLIAWQADANSYDTQVQINQVVIATDLTIACSSHYISLITDHCLIALIPLIETTY